MIVPGINLVSERMRRWPAPEAVAWIGEPLMAGRYITTLIRLAGWLLPSSQILNALFDMKGGSLSETVMSIPVTDRAYVQRRTFGTAWRGGTPIRERLEA
jgi:hypothetical protein